MSLTALLTAISRLRKRPATDATHVVGYNERGGAFLFPAPGGGAIPPAVQASLDELSARIPADLADRWPAVLELLGVAPPSPPPPPPSGAAIPLVGVNASGMEFEGAYLVPTDAALQYFLDLGCNVFRVPFRWFHVQPTLGGALDTAKMADLDHVVSYVTSRGAVALIDMHDYGYRPNGSGGKDYIGGGVVTSAHFANGWGRLGEHYAGNPLVRFGLMNEPEFDGFATAQAWADLCIAASQAIRAAGATQQILVPTLGGQLAGFFEARDYEAFFAAIKAANLGNYAIEVHQYFDQWQAGNTPGVVSPTIGVERIAAHTAYFTANEIPVFLGEFGAGESLAGALCIDGLLAFMQAHPCWIGCTAYGAGGRWPDNYELKLDPLDTSPTTMRQVTASLRAYAPGGSKRGVAQQLQGFPLTFLATPTFADSAGPLGGRKLVGSAGYTMSFLSVHKQRRGAVEARFTLPAGFSAWNGNGKSMIDGGGLGLFVNSAGKIAGRYGMRVLASNVSAPLDGAAHTALISAGPNGAKLYLDGVQIAADTVAMNPAAGRYAFPVGVGTFGEETTKDPDGSFDSTGTFPGSIVYAAQWLIERDGTVLPSQRYTNTEPGLVWAFNWPAS